MTLQQGTQLQSSLYNYIIEKVLGQGTFGITYLAKVELKGGLGSFNSNIYVTVKEFFMKEINGRDGTSVTSTVNTKGGLFYDYKQKFAREAKNLSKLKHPNIVNVMDFFEANKTCYYVMEYLSGGDLDTLIEKRGRLSEEETISYTRQIGSALSFMHQNKMLHLDLKPKNVVLNTNNDAILIDFGLSKQYDSTGEPESSTTVGRGTPGYAPLEQANYQDGHGFPVTMDVYALGATMFKMLTGKRAPEASFILNDGFPEEDFQGNICSSSTLKCIVKAMSPLKKDRFDSIDQLLQNLTSSAKTTTKHPGTTEETVVELPLKIGKNTNAVEIHYFEGSFPTALSVDIITSKNICSYDIYNYRKQLAYGSISNFDWDGFVRTFNNLSLVLGDKRGDPGTGGSSIDLVVRDKDNHIIEATQFGRDQSGTLHGNAEELLVYLESIEELQNALIAAKKKLQGDVVDEKPEDDNQSNPKKSGKLSKIIMSMMLILFFVACFWFIWTPKQEYRHVGTDRYYSYYIVGEPIKGWHAYKWPKDADIKSKIHRHDITKENWDSISVTLRPSAYDLRVQRISCDFTLDHQARLDSIKQERQRCSYEDRESFYVFYCQQKVGDEYIVKDSIEVSISKY